jgi:hypothetical protein
MDALLKFAKILTEGTGDSCGIDRDVYHRAIEKRALETKRANETLPQAYTRVVTETDEGRLLLKAYRSAPVAPPPKQAPQDLKYQAVGEASAELEEMARAEAKSKNITFQQAFARLLTNPDRAKLRERVMAEERHATLEVRRQRWPMDSAERQSLTREWARNSDI